MVRGKVTPYLCYFYFGLLYLPFSGCPIFIFARPRRTSRRTHAGNICRRPTLPARAPSVQPQPNNKGSLKTINPIFMLPFIAPRRR